MHTFPSIVAGVLGLGGPELIVILVILLVLFGGSKLPDLAKGLGKSIKEFKKATQEDPAPPAPAPVASTPAPAATPAKAEAAAPQH